MTNCGIYVLYGDDDDCLYVGRSRDMEGRVKTHSYTKQFARVAYHPCPPAQLRQKERDAINTLRPALNRLRPVGSPEPRTGINLTASDLQVLRALKRQLEPEHGKLTTTAVIRLALRSLRAQ